MGKVLVTGATGHIGSNVVRALLAEPSQTPVALARKGADRRGLEGLDIEVREGDVLDPGSIARSLDGIEAVIHCAAVHRNFAADESEILGPAVEGTKNVLDACAERSVARMVLTSSGATIGFAPSPTAPLDERATIAHPKAPYLRAKVEQEKLALADDRLDVVVLNPSGVFGPHDYRLTPATRALMGLVSGDPSILAVSVTDVRDVATAHVRALVSGNPKERYLITGDVLTKEEVSATLARIVGFGPKPMSPPRFLLNVLAWFQERKARSNGTDAPITRAILDDAFGKHLAYDNSKSKRELGMTYRAAEQVLADAIDWLLSIGAFPEKTALRIAAGRKRASEGRGA